MRVFLGLAAGIALLVLSGPARAQVFVLANPRAKPGEVLWRNAYIGARPQAWYQAQTPLTPELAAQAASRPPDSLSLVLPPDAHRRLPSGAQYLRVQLLNPTARPVPIERADATIMAIGLVLRLDDQWVHPAYMPESYCGNSFWQDTLAARSCLTFELEVSSLYAGTVPVQAQVRAQVAGATVSSEVFTVQLTPEQLYYLRYPRVPLPDIR